MSSDRITRRGQSPPPPPSWQGSRSAPELVRVPADTESLAAVAAPIEDEEEPVDELWADAKLEPIEPMQIGESERLWSESVVAPAPEPPPEHSPISDEAPLPTHARAPEPALPAPPKSKLPMILGATGLAAGLLALIVVLTRSGGEAPPGTASDPEAPTKDVVSEPADSTESDPQAQPDPIPEDDLVARARTALDSGELDEGMRLANELLEQDEESNAQTFIELACIAEDGVQARRVFRPLQGPKARARLAEQCETHGVDLYYKGDGPSATEYLRQAERAFEDEDWDEAYKLARSSSRVESSAKAIRIMALASCHNDDEAEAKRLLKMLLPSVQTEVEEACGL